MPLGKSITPLVCLDALDADSGLPSADNCGLQFPLEAASLCNVSVSWLSVSELMSSLYSSVPCAGLIPQKNSRHPLLILALASTHSFTGQACSISFLWLWWIYVSRTTPSMVSGTMLQDTALKLDARPLESGWVTCANGIVAGQIRAQACIWWLKFRLKRACAGSADSSRARG